MKKYFILLFVCLCFLTSSFAQSNLKAFLAYSSFSTPNNGPFFETYLTVVGNSVIYKKNELGKFQGAVEISLAFVQDETIKNFKKYVLLSEEVDSEEKPRSNFIDQQRFFLANGTYTMELEISDKNASSAPFKYQEKITIDLPADKISLSDIELIESYKETATAGILSKSGYDLIPYVSKYYPQNFNTLTFYAEIYNANIALADGQKYLVSYYIEDFDNKEKLNAYSNFAKYSAVKVSSLLSSFAIDNLKTGNYNLCIELRDRENRLLTVRKLFFQRSNPRKEEAKDDLSKISLEKTFVKNYNDIDSLERMIESLKPIATQAEFNYANNQLQAGDLDMMKRYFYSFWLRRNALNPQQEWLNYKIDVDEVDALFSTSARSKKGFNSDRGRVYLRYGKPDIRSVNTSESLSYPYEIWQYNVTKDNQTNRRFVFYNPYGSSNDYRLIHSDAFGEVKDDRWRMKIDARKDSRRIVDQDYDRYNIDKENLNQNDRDFGRHVDDLFNDPR
jgi:GWxTD domain-containing protein